MGRDSSKAGIPRVVLPGDLLLGRSIRASDPIGDDKGDAAWVFSVAAIDRLNIPSSLGQSELGRLTASQLRRGRRLTFTVSAPEEGDEILKLCFGQAMLRQEICRILLPSDLC